VPTRIRPEKPLAIDAIRWGILQRNALTQLRGRPVLMIQNGEPKTIKIKREAEE
jgi:hypothetical protein